MKQRGIAHPTLMILVCGLPLLVFFLLALAGVGINPLWVPIIMMLCCLAMFYLAAGCCGNEHPAHLGGASPTVGQRRCHR